jgi:signal transduction histidine kinase
MTSELSLLPIPALAIAPTEDANDALRALLGMEDVCVRDLATRYEVGWPGVPPLSGDTLPWHRAARGEEFEEEETWHDRVSGRTLQLRVRGLRWRETAVIALIDESEHVVEIERAHAGRALAAALLRADDLQGAARTVVDELRRALAPDAILAFAREPGETGLRLASSHGLAQVRSLFSPSAVLEAAVAAAAGCGRAWEIEDLARPESAGGVIARTLLENGIRSVIASPLCAGREAVGAVVLGWRRPGPAPPDARRLLGEVVPVAEIAFERGIARESRVRDLERRHAAEAALTVATGLGLPDLLRELLRRACAMTGARYGAAHALGAGGAPVHFVQVGIPEDLEAKIGRKPRLTGVFAEVARAGKPLRIPDLPHDPRFGGFPEHHPPMRSFAGAPMKLGAELLGMLYLADREDGAPFSQGDEDLLALLAGHAALAVAYAREAELVDERRRLLEDFAAAVAHDLRSPIQVLLIQARMLLAGSVADDVRVPVAALHRIERAGARLTRMVSDLLDVVRLEAGRLVVEAGRISLQDFLPPALRQLADLVGDHPIELTVEGPPDPIAGDAHRLEQILGNLVENAAKYGHPGTEIAVTARPCERGAVIVVRNSGPGIGPDDLPHVFDRYYRGAPSAAGAGGLGLGLFITKALVEAQGGRIWAESVPGEETSFLVELPRAPAGGEAPL